MRVLNQIFPATALLLAVTPWAAGQVGPGVHRRGILPMRGAGSADRAGQATATAGPQNIPYNGGAVLPNTTTYAFWWGKPSDFPSDAIDGLDDFLQGLDGSAYIGLANQYLFGQKAHTHFGGNLFDRSAPPNGPPYFVEPGGFFFFAPEIVKILTQNGQKPDPNGIYVVYSSNFPNDAVESGYCAFHGADTAPDGTILQIVYVPNLTSALSGCGTDFDPLFTPNNHSEAVRAMANATAHEFMETITDPNADAWADYSTGNEIGDPCSFVFESWVPLTDSRWKIQEIWSNQAGGCVQGAGRAEGRVFGAFENSGAVSTFDIPAVTYGTFAQSMNPAGAITGYYVDAAHDREGTSVHSFERDSHGIVTTFDPPGVGYSIANSINAEGAIAGYYYKVGILHGFVRDNQGTFATIDVPGAAGTSADSINAAGVIAGHDVDANSVNHGFLRNNLGTFATFDAPGAGNGAFGGTFVTGINENGAVAGYYLDFNSVRHGFVRHKDGSIATFDAPGAGNAPGEGTFAYSINAEGDIAGHYTDTDLRNHSFVREGNGTFVTFDVPDAIYGTFAYSINAAGAVAGYYSDASGFPHGFVRSTSGAFTSIDTPGESYGTVLLSISDAGAGAGYHTAPIH
jgi:hypothetical protein